MLERDLIEKRYECFQKQQAKVSLIMTNMTNYLQKILQKRMHWIWATTPVLFVCSSIFTNCVYIQVYPYYPRYQKSRIKKI